MVNAPARLHAALRERYTRPPKPGSIVIADEGETWTAVAPTPMPTMPLPMGVPFVG